MEVSCCTRFCSWGGREAKARAWGWTPVLGSGVFSPAGSLPPAEDLRSWWEAQPRRVVGAQETREHNSLRLRPQHRMVPLDVWFRRRCLSPWRGGPSDLIALPAHFCCPRAAGMKPFSCSASRTREASVVSGRKWVGPSCCMSETGLSNHFITTGMSDSWNSCTGHRW